MALDVDRKQRFLHDILWVDSALALHLAPGEATHKAGCTPEELAIGSLISRDCGSHQPGKFVFVPAAQAGLPPKYVRARSFITGTGKVLFQLWKLSITNSCRRQDVTRGAPGSNRHKRAREMACGTQRETTTCLPDQP
jgi:hypothetical protein